MREEEVVMEKRQKVTMRAEKLIASVVGNYRGSGSCGRSRKEVVEEETEEVEQRVMSSTV